MSGGLRTSVKGLLIANRLALPDEIDAVHETNETQKKSIASTSCELSTGDGSTICSPVLSYAAMSMDSNWTRDCRAERLPRNVSYFPRTEGEILLRRFFLNELITATWNFHPDNMVGKGGYASVFKGWLGDNSSTAANSGKGKLIAVKRINQESIWLTEIYYLGRLRHPNLVNLLGYCFEDDHRLLVFEFMPRGGLDNYIFGSASYCQPLPWILRMKIALSAANVLAFLHNGNQTVIHVDVTSSNILLDSTYNAKLADFGLAKNGPAGGRSHVSTTVMGTHGYAAPEYIATGHLTAKCDVYGFGVVMLEMLSGRRSVDPSRPQKQQNLVNWVKPRLASKRVLRVVDPRMKGQYPVPQALKAAGIVLQCLSEDPKYRPNMSEVVDALEQLQELDEPCQVRSINTTSDRKRSTSCISFIPFASRSFT